MEKAKDIFLLSIVLIIAMHAAFSYIMLLYHVFFRNTFRNKTPSIKYQRYSLLDPPFLYRKLMLFCVEFLIISLYFQYFTPNAKSIDNADISTRIENISQDLEQSSAALLVIQQELEERVEFVEKLKTEAEIAENVISLTEEQVKAVQAKLNEELEESGNKNLIQGILISAFFFVLGLISQPIFNFIKKKTKKSVSNDAIPLENKYSDEEIQQALRLLNTIKQTESSSIEK